MSLVTSVDVASTGYTVTVIVATAAVAWDSVVPVVEMADAVPGTTAEVALAVVVPGVGVIMDTVVSGVVGAFSRELVRVHVTIVEVLVTIVSAVKSVFFGWHILVEPVDLELC